MSFNALLFVQQMKMCGCIIRVSAYDGQESLGAWCSNATCCFTLFLCILNRYICPVLYDIQQFSQKHACPYLSICFYFKLLKPIQTVKMFSLTEQEWKRSRQDEVHLTNFGSVQTLENEVATRFKSKSLKS